MDDVHNLASGTDREVAEWRTTLNNHTNMLNGMSEQIDERFTKVDKRFDKVDQNFAKVETKFKLLQQGQDRITKLLTRHLGEPDEETRAGDAGE
jgi:SMC interacting uncharacterized protein involved in chromosome segregation